ncbi:hypothetical protein GF407_07845 [candidate division KSB1 bacterium]|nr:hypothetical protein [candidate division KSB1 bacterium]
MKNQTIRIGIIGAGQNTRDKHIPELQKLKNVEIAGVCNRSRTSSEKVAEKFNIPNIYENWKDLITAGDSNAILIGAWPYLHHPAVMAALEADKHVLCEARMAMNAGEAEEMYRASLQKPHLVAQLVPAPFTLRVDEKVKRLIDNGFIGDILAVNITVCSGTFLNPAQPLTWRQNIRYSGLNIMMMGIYYEALMRWIGEADRVFAMGKTFAKMRKNPECGCMEAVHIPEHLNITADMVCGAQAQFQFSNVCGLAAADEILLMGSRGTLRITDNTLYGGQRGEEGLKEIPVTPEEEGHWRVEASFVNAIRGKEEVTLTTFEQGRRYMAFTEAVHRSMQTGKAVPV